jgi:hypothetical protein
MTTREMIAWIRKSTGGSANRLSEQVYRPDLASVLPGDFEALTPRQREVLASSTKSFARKEYLLSPDSSAQNAVADILSVMDQRMTNAESGIRPKPLMSIGPAGLGKSTMTDTMIRVTNEASQGRLRVYELSATQLLDDPLYAPLNTKNLCALIRDWYDQPDMLSPKTMEYLREPAEKGTGTRGDSLMSLTGKEYDGLAASLSVNDDIPGLPRFQGDASAPAAWDEYSRRITGFSFQGFRQLSPLGAEMLNLKPAYFSIIKIEEFLLLTPQQQDSALGLISAAGSSADTATNAVPFTEKDFLSGYQRRKAMSRQYNPCLAVYVTSNPDEGMTGRIGTRMDFVSIPPTYSQKTFQQILAVQMLHFLRDRENVKAGSEPISLDAAEKDPDRYFFKSNLARLSEENLEKVIHGAYQYAGQLLKTIGSNSNEINQLTSPGRFISGVRESLDSLPGSNNIFARPCIDWFISHNQKVFRPGVTTPIRIGESLLRACVGDDALNTPAAKTFWEQTFSIALDGGETFKDMLGKSLAPLAESSEIVRLPTGKISEDVTVETTVVASESPEKDFARKQLSISRADPTLTPKVAEALPTGLQFDYSGLIPLSTQTEGAPDFLLIQPGTKIGAGSPKQFAARPMEFHLASPQDIAPEDHLAVVRGCARLAVSPIVDNPEEFTTAKAKKQPIYVPREFHPETGEMSYAKFPAEDLIARRRKAGNMETLLDTLLDPATNFPITQPSERDAKVEKEGERAPFYPMKVNPLPLTPQAPADLSAPAKQQTLI